MQKTNVEVSTPDGPQVFPGITPESREVAIEALKSQLARYLTKYKKLKNK